MICKYQDLNEKSVKNNKFFLLYGKNEGLKNEIIEKLTENRENIYSYDEKEILLNIDEFINSISTKSLFEDQKTILIKRSTDKILNIVNEVSGKNLGDISIILISDNLDKKSKIRSFFEKDKKKIVIAFYPDTEQVLFRIGNDYLRKKKIFISPNNLNLIVSRCNGDRKNLMYELQKINLFSKNEKKLTQEIINKLTSLNENHSISELIDNCLAQNKKKIIHILNENNFTQEDCIVILRTLLVKSLKILKLSNEYKNNKNIDLTISSAKPPIFWKDKEITKQQIYKWKPDNIKALIYKINEIELLVKKNFNNSINLITNFLLEQVSIKT